MKKIHDLLKYYLVILEHVPCTRHTHQILTGCRSSYCPHLSEKTEDQADKFLGRVRLLEMHMGGSPVCGPGHFQYILGPKPGLKLRVGGHIKPR